MLIAHKRSLAFITLSAKAFATAASSRAQYFNVYFIVNININVYIETRISFYLFKCIILINVSESNNIITIIVVHNIYINIYYEDTFL